MRWQKPALLSERSRTRFAWTPVVMGVPQDNREDQITVWLERYVEHKRLGIYGWYVWRRDAMGPA